MDINGMGQRRGEFIIKSEVVIEMCAFCLKAIYRVICDQYSRFGRAKKTKYIFIRLANWPFIIGLKMHMAPTSLFFQIG